MAGNDSAWNKAQEPWPSERLGWIAVLILSLGYVLSYVDRIVISLLVDPIRSDFGISDTQFGMLQGLAFGLFYTVLALPIGRLADQGSRRAIIAAGIVVFSACSVLSGLARNYVQLFLARVGVGAGEAALTPTAYSLISDYFPPHRLGRAISTFTMSAYLGMGLAYIAGGTVIGWLATLGLTRLPLLGEMKPWQMAFVIIAIPGFLLAPAMFLIREPVRRGRARLAQGRRSIPVKQVVAEVWSRRAALGLMFFGYSMVTLSGYASHAWTPAFFIRTYGWSASDVGVAYGMLFLVFGPGGALFAGWLCDRLTLAGYADAPLRVAAWGALAAGLFGGLAPLMPSPDYALLLFAPTIFAATMPMPLAGTAIQLLVPNQLRGQVSALYMLVINLIGLGVGPTVVGLITDHVFMAEADLRYSLALVNAACAPLAFLLLLFAWKPFRRLRQSAAEGEGET